MSRCAEGCIGLPPADDIETLEEQLSDFDPATRTRALAALARLASRGEIALPPAGANSNLHIHSFFSFNADGHSPSRIAWEARKAGLLVAGIVDFDVLDGLEEFLAAGDLLGLRATVGVESRVFVPEYADKEISSPGEPGIAYYMGVGFHRPLASGCPSAAVFARMRELARRRNEGVVARVNRHLGEAAVDYERDVLPLAPSGNATERHMLVAYEAKAAAVFPELDRRRRYWAEKLGESPDKVARLLGDSASFRELVRSRLMKKGGVGYASPERGDFPLLDEMARAVSLAGAIPTATWLDGTSDGERDPEEVVAFHVSKGALALNVIPDRSWNLPNPEEARRKLQALHAILRSARAAGLVLVHGTERNRPGQKFVDDLACEALRPLAEAFTEGALAVYGHTAMARWASRPLGGEWSRRTFGSDARARNRFYAEVGRLLEPSPSAPETLERAVRSDDPEAILRALRASAQPVAFDRGGS